MSLSPLDAAHRGYDYQDLLSALRLIDVLLGRLQVTNVDEKLFDGDLFDDLTTLDAENRRERFQFKHRDAPTSLSLSLLTTQDRDLKLDAVLACALTDRDGPGVAATSSRYRIVLRDGSPEARLQPFVRPSNPDPGPFSVGFRSSRYHLDADKCWPRVLPTPHLRRANDPFVFLRSAGFARDDFEWLCNHLVIEVNAPEASFDLTRPGPAEEILLDRIRREVGAESYPNQDRSALDIAQALIATAKAARQRRCQPTLPEILSRTRLRSDFGAVSRAHPVDASREVTREGAVLEVVARAQSAAALERPLLLVGPPGQGKSWICHQILAKLKENGWLTAEHYCFLGEFDYERSDRVLTERIIGSLLARLADADPSLVEQQLPRYAADEAALVKALERSLEKHPERNIALVVDGLDHITRVQGSTIGRPDPSQRLAQQLASLELPKGCIFIVLSQPGDHLEPLRSAGVELISVPALEEEELFQLADKMGTLLSVSDASSDMAETKAFISSLKELSSGNALYATYICREVLLRPFTAIDPPAVLKRLPTYDGTLHSYYTYLVSAIQEGVVADTLALIDFSLTRDDLREIWPASAHRIDAEIDRLAPALLERSAQGGLRIYHESFSRFLRAAFEQNEGARLAILTQVSRWLEQKGLFADSRAFEFLFPLLEQMGRPEDVLEQIDPKFLWNAVANGFPPAAMLANIAVGLRCSSQLKDWGAIARLVELSRAAESFEYERLGETLVDFADVVITLLCGKTLAERLLHNGRTTVPARAGLQLCAAIDASGFTAPWREYIDAFVRESEERRVSYPPSSDQKVAIARLRGHLRGTFPSPELVPADYDWSQLAKSIEKGFPPESTIATLCDTIGSAGCLEVVSLVKNRAPYALALAERCARQEDHAVRDAALAIAIEHPPRGAVPALLALGVTPEQLLPDPASDLVGRLVELTKGVQGERADPNVVASWMDVCALAARLKPIALTSAEALIQGAGWYRCWLKFVARISQAEMTSDPHNQAIAALHVLEGDLDPFSGTPRACDLYEIGEHIATTLRRALALLNEDTWAEGVETLLTVAQRLQASALGELWGPIDIDDCLGIIISLTSEARRTIAEAAIKDVLSRTRGRFYSEIAGLHLLHARCALRCGDSASAREHWYSACELLVAYGWRRDRTIFELLDPIEALMGIDAQRARVCLAHVQAACLRVLRHTDGKDTRSVLTQWFALLASADATAASVMISSPLLSNCNDVLERCEKTRVALWRSHFQQVHPAVAGALRLTIAKPLDKHDPEVLGLIIADGQQSGSTAAQRLVMQVVSRTDERPTRYPYSNSTELLAKDDTIVASINSVLAAANLPKVVKRQDSLKSDETATPQRRLSDQVSTKDLVETLIIDDFGKDPLSLARLIRTWRRRPFNSAEPRWTTARFANAIGYRLIEMAEAGQVDDAEVALRALADVVLFENTDQILASLAEGLELHAHPRLAAIAYVLCWTRSRGGGGWLTFGGETGLDSLSRAVALDRDAAFIELTLEIQKVVTERRSSLGLTQALIYAFALVDLGSSQTGGETLNSSQTAFAIWDEAQAVITSRTPRISEGDDPNPLYIPSEPDDPDKIERALALALVAGLGHPSREQKRRTLVAISLLIEIRAAAIRDAVRTALDSLSDPSTLYWLLWLLRSGAGNAVEVIRAAAPTLKELCRSEFLGIRTLARQLLVSVEQEAPALPVGEPMPSLVGKSIEIAGASPRIGADTSLVDFVAGSRIASVRALLPGLLEAVAVALDAKRPQIMDRMNDQQQSLSHPSDKHVPDAFLATMEAAEAELQCISGLGRVSLASVGSLVPDAEAWEERVASRLENNPRLALAIERTREPRPDIAAPPHASNALSATMRTAAGADADTVATGPFRGFRVVASLEFRILLAPAYSGGERRGVRCLGLELGAVPDPKNMPPLGNVDSENWFSPARVPSIPVPGPLVGEHNMPFDAPERLGLSWSCPVLVPQPWLIRTLALEPDGHELLFKDGNGVAIALRTWRSDYLVDDYRLARPSLTGSQLVLREDLFQRLLTIVGQSLVLRDFIVIGSAET